jgi:RNA polymerase sigma-70 factor (ECF subfamily)
MSTDDELMAQMRDGSRAAFEALFGRYRDPIWRFFRRRVADAARAEELAQDTFVAVFQGVSRFEGRGSVRSYLFGTAYHVLLADRRKTRLHAVAPLDADPADPRDADPDAGIWVRAALAALDEDTREILMLREYEQLSYQEIADLRHTPLNTVRSQLFRARAALKAALEARAPREIRTSHG